MKPRQRLNSNSDDQNDSFQFINQQAQERETLKMISSDSPKYSKCYNTSSFLQDDDDENFGRPYHPSYDFSSYNKKYSNLAAIDCFATIYGINPYQKTYQDQLDVDHLVEDVYSGGKPLFLDKFFDSQEQNQNMTNQPQKTFQQQMRPNPNKFDSSIQMLSPDFHWNSPIEEQHQGLNKLFEDPAEKQQMILNNIQRSQNKKRQRLNSGTSNQSQQRSITNNQQKIYQQYNIQYNTYVFIQ